VNAPPEPGPAGQKTRRTVAAFIAPAAVSAFLVWLLLRGLSWRNLVGSILSASPASLAIYALIGFGALWLRAVRFRILLPDPKPAPGFVFFATAVQNALSDLVPARLASLGSYVWLMKRRHAVTAESAAATFIASFVLDMVSLGPFLLLAAAARFGLSAPIGRSQLPLTWIVAFGAVFFAASAMAAWWLGPMVRMFGRLPRALARGRNNGGWVRVAASLDRIAAAMETVRRGGALARLVVISLAIRLLKYASLYALTEGLLAGAGYVAQRPNPWDLVIGVSATELVASLPIPAIGQFGVWEGGMVGVLVMMGFLREPATLVAFGVHAITTAYEYLIGFLALGAMLVLQRRRRGTP
jgi:uncharacterized membrane protein YbhN (UPF0104 family)